MPKMKTKKLNMSLISLEKVCERLLPPAVIDRGCKVQGKKEPTKVFFVQVPKCMKV